MVRLRAVRTFVDLGVPAITFLVLLAVGLVGPLLVLPPLALLLVVLFAPSSDLQAGLLLIAACPIGGISTTYSYLAGASTALSVSLTAGSSLLAVVTIPLLDRVFGAVMGRALGFTAPVALIFAQLLLMLAVPVALGMWIRFRRPALALRSARYLKAVGFGALGVLILSIVASDAALFLNGLRSTVPLAAAFVVASFTLGWLVARATGTSPQDRFTLATEFATRNVAVAAAIAVTLAGRIEFALFATTYFLSEIPLMLGAIAAFRRWHPAKA
jgi:bile acid:Na+ symporter, BASS family